MSDNATNWVAEKLVSKEGLQISGRTQENFLVVGDECEYTFLVAVLGIKGRIERSDVEPLFSQPNKPDFIVNIPSNAIWTGEAINFVHQASAAFGTLSEVISAYSTGDAGSYREKNMNFYTKAFLQHSNVTDVSFVYRTVLKIERRRGESLIIAIVDAYNMSAEDIRNTWNNVGYFDIALKSTSYGGITSNATSAAKSMGAEALMFSEVMSRLSK
ncbi:hypothetical protein [Pseudomonas oryziphila]|uniref:Uncharacterized protein n=1 Tax=Pseudomonas oryziphila TaxID=2894079 RepID=A0ABN5THQ3_9PSED|nr:hypothetical protein [Pseudomonas oryziphila]AZL74683.1 hypothetical protein EI693_17020 [Pseudomonas oryziphila]